MFQIRSFKRTFTLVLVLILLLIILRNYLTNPKPSNKVKQTQPVAGLIVTLPDNYAFRQDDPRWGAHKLGNTEDSLSEYGCTVTSVAVAASNLLKTEISPAEINIRLTKANGYTDKGWLIWKHVGTATEGKLRAVMNTEPSHEAINQCMLNDGYPIIKIDIGKGINHWAVIVGQSKADYFIRDPLIGQNKGQINGAPIPLSSRSDYIYATRCISLNQR